MVGKKLGILFLAAVVLSFFAGYYAQNIVPGLLINDAESGFDLITEELKNYYYYEIDDNDIDQAYIDALAAVVNSYAISKNDPYTRLYQVSTITDGLSDEYYVGLGIEVSYEDNNVRILNVFDTSDAFGKLIPGDLIIGLKVQDVNTYFDDMSFAQMNAAMTGEVNEQKTFIIETADGNIIDVDLIYQQIETASVEVATTFGPSIGYLKINRFFQALSEDSPGTSYLFKQALSLLETEILNTLPEQKTLVLDLRDNPGGALSALHNGGDSQTIPGIIQDLLPRNLNEPLFQMIPRDQTQAMSFYSDRLEAKPYDIVVLVNENSASASEVLAATLSYAGGYTIYGQPTYGKNVYQNSVNLFEYEGFLYGITYTEGMWFYGDGLDVQTTPIPVVNIEQSGYLAIDSLYYSGEVGLDDVNLDLAPFQDVLNLYLDLDLRNDGYFDQATETAVATFQNLMGLTVTGTLNRETAKKLYSIYVISINDLEQDVQLNTLIEMINA